MINWGDYSLYEPPVLGPPENMSRRDARVAYADVMEKKPERLDYLKAFAARNGVVLDGHRESTDRWGRWLYEHVEEDPVRPGRLLGDWYSLVFDSGLFVGDLIIAKNPARFWKMQEGGKRHVSYQKPVIAGFDDPRYSVDPDRFIAGLGYAGIKRKPLDDSPIWEYVAIAAGEG
ncbi:hypothetical protein LLS1_36950 [Leifsonia sp. LS1]|uniref:hypothetical protein n=1 Tax=Leifsonia sp. LS1 TaxID=2828483 RepID=UPI001CFE24B7|nr:hypothetical protein [Leifsonia sp. LS1]GIT82026.1 hypothetical protein LLS1_36950 [Leifsonia sp. LS1]